MGNNAEKEAMIAAINAKTIHSLMSQGSRKVLVDDDCVVVGPPELPEH